MFWINNVLMPTPDEDGISVKYNKLWSKNAGRTASGYFVGDVVAKKATISITYSRKLTSVEVSTLDNAISANAFMTVKVLKPGTDSTYITKTCYAEDYQFDVHKRSGGAVSYNGTSFAFTER